MFSNSKSLGSEDSIELEKINFEDNLKDDKNSDDDNKDEVYIGTD